MTKSELYNGVCRIKEYLEIGDESYPIDMFELCSKIHGLEVEKIAFKTKDLRGMLCVANDSSENSVILVNSNKSLVEQNYHCAHEFMHLFNDAPAAGTIIRCFDKLRPNQNRYVEWLANEGAAELLVPYFLFIPSFLKCRNLYLNNYDAWRILYGHMSVFQALAAEFGVSEMVIMHRIENLSHEIEQYCTNGGSFEGIMLTSKSYRQKHGISVYDYIGELKRNQMFHDFGVIINNCLPSPSSISVGL